MSKKEEANDIVQYLLPELEKVGIKSKNIKNDVTTEKSGAKRGDIWISLFDQISLDFEKGIVGLIEAKHRKTNIGDMNWRDAMKQGKEKANNQGLAYYIVTNCKGSTRYYNAHNDEEIILDGKVITEFVELEILQKIQSQVNEDISNVVHKTKREVIEFSESDFRRSLGQLEQIYRSAGIRKGDERIDPTVSFVVLKYISEKENEKRTLNGVIQLWDDFKSIVTGEVMRDLSTEFNNTVSQIWGKGSPHNNNQYKDFENLVTIPSKLTHEHCVGIYKELDTYHFHGGAKFDLFGTIYEEFATQSKKKEFGEFYTRRHITNMTAKLLFRKEKKYRKLNVCDPACGTGGFLTEAYKVLIDNYTANSQINAEVIDNVRKNFFWGFDNDPQSVARTKLNMFLVGDGHNHIYENDSLKDWNKHIKWSENMFDYILANPPMGTYSGDADIDKFEFTSESRYQLLFLERIIKATKVGGEIAIVIDDGVLETPSRAEFRKKVLEECNINAIVSITKFAFAPYTKEKTYIMFIQKNKRRKLGKFKILRYGITLLITMGMLIAIKDLKLNFMMTYQN
ncbi:N-6 DNA methylase [Staphylococcus equorum]|uniref:HsdM family class I SAM-dependent methyltransferase n=1 Tax=Staphylococcus equorum TaxID=246432 RepID=UPI003D80808C